MCPAWRSSQLPRALQGWHVLGEAARAPTGQTPRRLPGGQSPHTAASPCPAVGEPTPSPSPWHPARPAPILLPCVSRLPAASPVWRREEPRLAALAAICTSRLWGRVAAPAPRSPGPWGSRAGWWQKAGERLAATGDAPWEKPLQAPRPAATSCPHTWHTRGHGLGFTWHHTVGGDRTHGNGRQHRLREETQCGPPAELGRGTGEWEGELGPC